MIPNLISHEPFIPHTLAHLNEVRAFPSALPEQAYTKMQREYETTDDVNVWRILYNSDGLAITGMLGEPTNWSAGDHPLIIYNRGGSHEYGKLTLLSAIRDIIPYAKQGYIIAASNYRGADGSEGEDEFGGKDVNDILNLLNLAKNHPGFDGKNVYMIGHSRGAMMTYIALRQGANPNAAICLAGMGDLFMTAKARPDIEKGVWHQRIKELGLDRDTAYKERSVLNWIDQISTPIQLHHGDNDKSVNVDQSEAISKALQEQGNAQELHIYPGDNHALLRNWNKVVKTSTQWMRKFEQ